ncbi:MAG: hypothetical protein IT445_08465 [Phycisphaeraceae bacterium]|nr:hypothetical protein [Phycisphaeraceae bacterium]
MIGYHCRDLIFATKIRSTADALGAAVCVVNNESKLAQVSRLLVDLDTGETALALIRAAKAADVPTVAFGSHVAVDLLQQAKEAGADSVLPRSAFVNQLPEMLSHDGTKDTKK